jgi:type I restriction enzyme R subunit
MGPSPYLPIQVFDPSEDFSVVLRQLPHWSQAGTISFMTWRTWDSIPQTVLEEWIVDRNKWLLCHGISPDEDWHKRIERLSPSLRREFHRRISDRWNDALDSCFGECVLRLPTLSQIVANSLLHFDEERCRLTDFVIMPNHIHLLAAFPNEESMLTQYDSWKHYTATQINRQLGRNGRFWQQDGFDHLVRSLNQFEYLRKYIANNPNRARLQPGEYIHWTKAL